MRAAGSSAAGAWRTYIALCAEAFPGTLWTVALRASRAFPTYKALGVQALLAAEQGGLAEHEEELLDELARMVSQDVDFAEDPLPLLV